jgi:TonB family protein
MNGTRRQTGKRARLSFAVLVAIALHVQTIVIVALLAHRWAPRDADLQARWKTQDAPETIGVAALDEEASRRILAELEREQEKAQEEEERKERESTTPPGQVVEVPKPVEERRPENARFVAEHDSSVERETRKLGRFDPQARAGAATEARAARPAAPAEATPPTPPAPTPGLLAMRTPSASAPPAQPTAPSVPTDEDGVMPRAPVAAASPAVPAAPAEGPPPGAPPRPASLLPSGAQLASLIGAGTQDHLEDIDDGDTTQLNARAWKYASFFNRVKRQVVEHWKPGAEYEKRDPTGQIYGAGQRVTVLRLRLKGDGKLDSVSVEKTSGLEFLDDVAIEAVKRAQPFANPPEQLVDRNSGVISFRFGFFFEVGGAPKMKVYRYSSI